MSKDKSLHGQPHLAREVARLERRVAEGALLLSLGSLVLALLLVVFVDRRLGVVVSCVVGLMAAWFWAVRLAMLRGEGVGLVPRLAPFVEVSLVTLVFALDMRMMGARYALAVPTAPQFYAAIVLLQVVRLRRWGPLAVAVLGAAQYLALCFGWVRPALGAEAAALPEFSTGLLSARAGVLLLTGAMGSLVTVGLRHAVGNAEKSRRAAELFGKYRLGERVAVGGMGEVYRALYCPEGGFARPVALKRVGAQWAQQPRFVEAFRAEAELCARLLHPNIVQVLDFGRVEDTYFLAMEYMDGGTLSDLSERAAETGIPVPERVVVQVGRDILAGLGFAHAEARGEDGQLLGVVHRDLNPPNVLLARAGSAKVTDFGIARAVGASGAVVTGTVMGKSAYMSPEQACGEPLDARSDLFAAGIVLWELLTGETLFKRGSDLANMRAIVDQDAPPPSSRRQVAPGWDDFFRRALARGLDERFGSAAEMREALGRVLGGAPTRPDEVAAFVAQLRPAESPARAPAAPDAPTIPVARG